MASLRAQSQPRVVRAPILVNKIVSFITFLILLGAGWIALSYLKTQITGRSDDGVTLKQMRSTPARSVTPAEQKIRSQEKTKTSSLVYSAAGESTYYHTSTHLPPRGERSAFSEETARERGLKPCPICIRR